MRLARLLALAGIDSRRKCEEHVKNGAVKVNGEVVRELGRKVDPEEDEVLYRGRLIYLDRPVYYVMFKPPGYATTAFDPHEKKTVFDLLPPKLVPKTERPSENRVRVFPVGRLDKDSSGVLLFTNDGELANRMTHPRYGVAKWYNVRLDRAFDQRDKKKVLGGVRLEDGTACAERIQMLSKRTCRLMLREGKKREVRRLFEALGYEVVELCRTAFGPLTLGSLRPGDGYYLNSDGVESLKSYLKENAAGHSFS